MEWVDCMFETSVITSLTYNKPNKKVLFSPTIQFMPLRRFYCVCKLSGYSSVLHVISNSVFHFVNAW